MDPVASLSTMEIDCIMTYYNTIIDVLVLLQEDFLCSCAKVIITALEVNVDRGLILRFLEEMADETAFAEQFNADLRELVNLTRAAYNLVLRG
jgi:hypothetical protein